MTEHQVRRWTFTNHDMEHPITWDKVRDHARYLCYQEEICPTTGRHHQQGYIEFTRTRKLSWLIKYIASGPHYEIARGTLEDNKKYCSKPESAVPNTFVEAGTPMSQGQRTDLADVYNDIKAGKTIREVVDLHFPVYVKYHAGIEKAMMHLVKPRDAFPDVYLLVGPTRTGKSSFPNRFFKEEEIHRQLCLKTDKPFWGRYSQQKVVVLDEFTGQWSADYLKQLLDRYPITVDTKGGQLSFNSPVVFITSNKVPEHWWEGKEDLAPIYSRFKSYLLYESGDYREVIHRYQSASIEVAPFNEIPPSLLASIPIPPPPPLVRSEPSGVSSSDSESSSIEDRNSLLQEGSDLL